MSEDHPSPGLFAALRRLGDSALSLVHRRLELLSLELQEEKLRLVDVVVSIAAIIVLGILALVTATALVVVLLWEVSPIWALGGLTILYGGGALFIAASLRSKLKTGPRPFADTLAELKRDSEWLRENNSKK